MLVVAREDDFDFRSEEYSDLYQRAGATLFQHPLWLHRLYTTLAPARGASRVVVTARDEDGRLLLVLPLVARRRGMVRRVEFADLGVSDYGAPVLDRSAADRVTGDPQTVRDIRRALGPLDLIWLDKVVTDPEQLCRLLGTGKAVRQRYDTHTIALGHSFETWRKEALDPAFTRHLDRKRKRLRPKGELLLREVSDPAEIDETLVRMQAFREARFAERRGIDLVQDPDCFDFYQRVAKDSAAVDGPVHTSVLTVGGETVAASLGLADTERHLFLLVGYDFERFRNYSLGLLIVEELIALAISRGQHTFDLTVGNEGYKADFAATPSPVHTVRDTATWRGGIARTAADQNAAARRTAKRVLAERERRRSRAAAAAQG